MSQEEGNRGATVFTFPITLKSPCPEKVLVHYVTSDGSATASSDYVTVLSGVTFNPGETRKTMMVRVLGDSLPEANETFVVTLKNPRGAVLVKSQGIGIILNDDVPTLRIDDVSQAEGDSGAAPFTFTLTLSQASAEPVTVQHATLRGSAAEGRDYEPAAGSLTFNPGETREPLSVKVHGDTVQEVNKIFVIDLYNPRGAVLAKSQGVGTILNDDGFVLRIFNVDKYEGNGGKTEYVFYISLNRPNWRSPVTVWYSTANDTAAAGSDYMPASGAVTVPAGSPGGVCEG